MSFRLVPLLACLLALLQPAAAPAQSGGTAETLVLSFVGDIMHHDTNAEMEDYDRLYDAVRSYLQSDDLSFANIEFPVDPSLPPAGYPVFNGSPEYIRAAVDAGFDAFSLANNHSYDLRTAGVLATAGVFRDLARESGISYSGLRETEDAEITPTIIEINGWTVGFVAITAISNVGGSSTYVNLVDFTIEEAAQAFLEKVTAWSREVDLLIIGVHAGTEYVTTPDPAKSMFFRDLAAHGADIVWGHHPHVLQPWEFVRVGSSSRLVLNSTGNFISGQRRLQQPFLPFGRWAPTGDTAIFQVTVRRFPDEAAGPGHSRAPVAVTEVSTPAFTVHNDPVHGLVPKTFGAVLAGTMPLHWKAFYSARFAATRAVLDNSRVAFAYRRSLSR